MKILVLTKNNPIEILHTVERIYNTVSNKLNHLTCVSPQVTSLMIEETKGYPYLETYYSAIKTFEKLKDQMATCTTHFIVVGYVPKNTRFWYDAVVGLDNKDIEDYPLQKIPNNVDNIELFKLSDSEILFEDFETLRIFLKKATQEKKEDEL